MAYLSRAKLKFEAFCYFITYTTTGVIFVVLTSYLMFGYHMCF